MEVRFCQPAAAAMHYQDEVDPGPALSRRRSGSSKEGTPTKGTTNSQITVGNK